MIMNKDGPVKVKLIPSGAEVEISPGETIAVDLPRDAVSRYGIVQMMRQVDGSYLPVLCHWSPMVRVTADMGEMLGIPVSWQTIHRLIRGGFIRGRYISPQACWVDMGSFWDHLKATEDRDFWTPERLEHYREGCRAFAAKSRGGLNPEDHRE